MGEITIRTHLTTCKLHCTCGVSWPSGLVHWTQVLVLSECGFESRPGRSRRLCSWARHLVTYHSYFLHRMGCKAVGPVCCVMHVKEPRTLIVKEKGLAPVLLDSHLEHPAEWIHVQCMCALQIFCIIIFIIISMHCTCYHCKLFVFLFFLLCFRALSTQQGGYVRATNIYYYYYMRWCIKNTFFPVLSNKHSWAYLYPAKAFIKDDLPAPDGPMMAINSPGRKEPERPLRIVLFPEEDLVKQQETLGLPELGPFILKMHHPCFCWGPNANWGVGETPTPTLG